VKETIFHQEARAEANGSVDFYEARVDVMEREGFSNGVINQVGILPDQIVPSRLFALNASGNNIFLLLGHGRGGSYRLSSLK